MAELAATGLKNREIAKAAFMSGFERKILDACANNLTETCFDPSTGRPLQKLNSEYLHRSDAWFVENGLDPDWNVSN